MDEQIPIIIEIAGLRVKGVAVITGKSSKGTFVEYTIPNSHIMLKNGKLVKETGDFEGESYSFGIATSSYAIKEPLTQEAQAEEK